MRRPHFNWFDALVILLLLLMVNRLYALRVERARLAKTMRTVTVTVRVESVSPALVAAARDGLGEPVTNVPTGQPMGELVGFSSAPTEVVSRPGGPEHPSLFYRNLDLEIRGQGQVGPNVTMLGPVQLHIGTPLTVGIPNVSWSGLVWRIETR